MPGATRQLYVNPEPVVKEKDLIVATTSGTVHADQFFGFKSWMIIYASGASEISPSFVYALERVFADLTIPEPEIEGVFLR